MVFRRRSNRLTGMDFSVLSQRTVRASPIRSASVNLAPAVPYHTSIRVSLSTPIVVLKKERGYITKQTNSQDYRADEILHISKKRYFAKSPESQAKFPLFSGSHPNYYQLFQTIFMPFLSSQSNHLPIRLLHQPFQEHLVLAFAHCTRDPTHHSS